MRKHLHSSLFDNTAVIWIVVIFGNNYRLINRSNCDWWIDESKQIIKYTICLMFAAYKEWHRLYIYTLHTLFLYVLLLFLHPEYDSTHLTSAVYVHIYTIYKTEGKWTFPWTIIFSPTHFLWKVFSLGICSKSVVQIINYS